MRLSQILNPWLGNNQGIELPSHLALDIVEAISPYKEQLAVLTNQLGINLPHGSKNPGK